MEGEEGERESGGGGRREGGGGGGGGERGREMEREGEGREREREGEGGRGRERERERELVYLHNDDFVFGCNSIEERAARDGIRELMCWECLELLSRERDAVQCPQTQLLTWR